MKKVLMGALVISLGANAWLVTRPAPVTAPETVSRPVPEIAKEEPEPSTREMESALRTMAEAQRDLQDANSRLKVELDDARALAADAESLDIMAWLLYSDKPLAWKAQKILAIDDEKERSMAAWKLGRALAEDPGAGAMLLEALKGAEDPDVIDVLRQALRAGAAGKAPDDVRRQFVELMRSAPSPAVRAAAVRGVFMNQGFRGAMSPEQKKLADEMNAALVKAIADEQAPEVVGSIANAMAAYSPSPDAVEAFQEAARRLPPSKGRREVWKAIGRGTFGRDKGASMLQAFSDSTDAEERTDIAAGIARAANSMSGSMGGDPEARKQATIAARQSVRTLFGGTTDVDVRRDLLRGAMHGLGAVSAFVRTDDERADSGRFLRELAALEPHPGQQGRIEALAAAIETGSYNGTAKFREIMYADD